MAGELNDAAFWCEHRRRIAALKEKVVEQRNQTLKLLRDIDNQLMDVEELEQRGKTHGQ